MPSDWIPVQTGLRRKPEVLHVAEETGRSVHEVIGLLLDLWNWVVDESTDGRIASASMRTLCATVGADEEFWHALVRVGWLDLEGGIRVPQYEEYLANGARRRLKDAVRKQLGRVRRVRKASAGCPQNVRSDADTVRTKEGSEDKSVQDDDVDVLEDDHPGNHHLRDGPRDDHPRDDETLAVPDELRDLALYSADARLCRRWAALLAAWREAYPAVDILAEVRKAHAWEVSNPRLRKRNRSRFLGLWLSRAQDRARSPGEGGAGPAGLGPGDAGAGGRGTNGSWYAGANGRRGAWGGRNSGGSQRGSWDPLGRRSSFAKEGKFSDARFK